MIPGTPRGSGCRLSTHIKERVTKVNQSPGRTSPSALHSPANHTSSNMMLSRAFALAIASLPILAAATPVELDARQSCSTGDLQCCDSTETVSISLNLFGFRSLTLSSIGRLCCGRRPFGSARHRGSGCERSPRYQLLPDHCHRRGHRWQLLCFGRVLRR